MESVGYHALQLAPVFLGMSGGILIVTPQDKRDQYHGFFVLVIALIYSYLG